MDKDGARVSIGPTMQGQDTMSTSTRVPRWAAAGLLAWAPLAACAAPAAYAYDTPVTLTGTIVRAHTRDPDERPVVFPALRIWPGIDTLARKADGTPAEHRVRLLQLAISDDAAWDQVHRAQRSHVRVKVSGTLYHWDNGRQYTPVLLHVTGLAP